MGTGDDGALERLIPLVHRELHRIARRHMAHERAGHSLHATALVHEAYLRLVDAKTVAWRDRAHFLAVAAHVMRRILVDHARSRHYQKRGGGAAKVTFDEAIVVSKEPRQDVVALDEALGALAQFDERKSRVIELRFFGGLSVEETASVLNVSPDTVMRDWRLAEISRAARCAAIAHTLPDTGERGRTRSVRRPGFSRRLTTCGARRIHVVAAPVTLTYAYMPSRKWVRTLQITRYIPGSLKDTDSSRFMALEGLTVAAIAGGGPPAGRIPL